MLALLHRRAAGPRRAGRRTTAGRRLRQALDRPRRTPSTRTAATRARRTCCPARPHDDVALLMARTRRLRRGPGAPTGTLPADPAVVAEARRDVDRAADGLGAGRSSSFTTELVVSELVTNAIRHAAGPIRLRLIRERTLICEVFDGGGTAPHLRQPRTTDEGGRGLLLVSQLTQRWGTRFLPEGKIIWAEQSLDGPRRVITGTHSSHP